MISHQGNLIEIKAKDEDEGSIFCDINIQTKNVRASGGQWIIKGGIDNYNKYIEKLKSERSLMLEIGGEYAGAFELKISPKDSTGTYIVKVACNFDHPNIKGEIYGVNDAFEVPGEYLNDAFKPIFY